MSNGSRNLRYYVSYAWADEGDPDREAQVDALCEQARKRDIEIIRDKDALKAGDRISDFMCKIGGGDRVFVFLSKKYLTSPFCMNELFQMWKNSREDPGDFLGRVRLFTLDDASFSQPEERFKYAQYWQGKHDKLAELIRESPNLVSEADFKSFRLMDEFATRIGDILALFSDTVRPSGFQEFLKCGFDDPVAAPSPPTPHPPSPPLWRPLSVTFLVVLVVCTGLFIWSRLPPPENPLNTPPGSTGDSDTSRIKLIAELAQVSDPNQRIKIYSIYCSCEPDDAIKALLENIEYKVAPNTQDHDISTRDSKESIDNDLNIFHGNVCNGDYYFKIEDNLLHCKNGLDTGLVLVRSINTGSGKLNSVSAIVFHGTGGGSLDGLISVFAGQNDASAKTSVHLLIARNGTVIQFVPFDSSTWHAGAAKFPDGRRFNDSSISITLQQLPDQGYTEKQMEISKAIVEAIYSYYGKVPLVAFSQISNHSGSPGPTFPIDKLKQEVGSPSIAP